MSDDNEPDIKALLAKMNQLEMQFQKLTEDFTQLRHEMNELERKVDRRT